MGDTCCNPLSIGGVKDALSKHYKGVSVESISTGSSNAATDFLSGFWGNVNDEVGLVCAHLKALKDLEGGFNLVGFSQGGQFARAVVQRCRHEGLQIKSLVTFGGQHQGVANLPGCQVTSTERRLSTPTHGICKALMMSTGTLVYLPFIRSHVIQAQYFKAPFNQQAYLSANPFLPDLNNERPHQLKGQYKDNLLALDNFALIRFHDDITVVPRDSAWFSWYDGERVVPLQEQRALWREDRLGLRQLHAAGRLHFDEVAGGHMQFSWEDLIAMLDKYMSFRDESTVGTDRLHTAE